MNKYGLLFCSYASEEYVDKSLEAWLKFDNVIISAVSCLFENFEPESNIKNIEILNDYFKGSLIDSLFTSNKPLKEYEARNLSLQRLLKLEVDYIILCDADEIWSIQEIKRLFKFLDKNSQYCWYKIEYKNLVFNENTYIKGFNPARVFRIKYNNQETDYKLNKCIDDNDFLYLSKNGFVQDKWLPSFIISTEICNPLHYSWLNNDRSRKKVEYQKKRGWFTSFNWNYDKKCLEFNEEYYRNKEKPILYKLDED